MFCCVVCGVEFKWFGGVELVGFIFCYDSWCYVDCFKMLKIDCIFNGIIDMCLLLIFSFEDCVLIVWIIWVEVGLVW